MSGLTTSLAVVTAAVLSTQPVVTAPPRASVEPCVIVVPVDPDQSAQLPELIQKLIAALAELVGGDAAPNSTGAGRSGCPEAASGTGSAGEPASPSPGGAPASPDAGPPAPGNPAGADPVPAPGGTDTSGGGTGTGGTGTGESGGTESGQGGAGDSDAGAGAGGGAGSGGAGSGGTDSGGSDSGGSDESGTGGSGSGGSDSGESGSSESGSGDSGSGGSGSGDSSSDTSESDESDAGSGSGEESDSGASESGDSESGESGSDGSESESESGGSESAESGSSETESGGSESDESGSGESGSSESASSESGSDDSESGDSGAGGAGAAQPADSAADGEQSSGEASTAAPGTDGKAGVPGDLLNLEKWYLTLPVGPSGDPDSIDQPELLTYSGEHFKLTPEGDGVVFRAHAGGVTTENSSYARSELREMVGGDEKAAWSNTSGTHTLETREAITKTPTAKPEVVAAQIHDGGDDVLQIRLEGQTLVAQYADGAEQIVIDPAYKLGTPYDLRIVAANGGITVFYNGKQAAEIPRSGSSWYWKIGAYTQSNPEKGDSPDAVGEVIVYSLRVEHS